MKSRHVKRGTTWSNVGKLKRVMRLLSHRHAKVAKTLVIIWAFPRPSWLYKDLQVLYSPLHCNTFSEASSITLTATKSLQMEGEDEHHHESTSVFNRVKAKAKKIRDTLTKHDHDQEDDDDDDKEEIVDDPQTHGAPINDAAVTKSGGKVEASEQSGFSAERLTAMDVDQPPPARTVKPGDASHVHEQEERIGQPKVNNFGLTPVTDEAHKAPQKTPVSHSSAETDHNSRDRDPTRTSVPGQEEHPVPGQPKVNLQRPKGGLVEDPVAAPKDTPGAYTPSNYQSEVTDQTGKGGQEARISPVPSFDKLSIDDESKPKSGLEQNRPTGTEETFDSTRGQEARISPVPSFDKLSIDDESKPKSGLEQNRPTGTEETFDSTRTQEHSHDNSVKSASAADKAISAKNVVASTGTEETFDSTRTQEHSHDNSVKSASAADKATSAKNFLASKIGYGEQGDRGGHEVNAAGDKSKSSMPATALNYGKKIAVVATENLTSVYGKVTGAGSTDKSKMPGTNTGTGSEKERSVKDYFAEKLKPGKEDKALSEAISEALHRKKTEKENKPASPRPVTEVISDAWQNREEEQNEATDRPMGKVTESEEVARRLDNTEHDSSKEGTNSSVVNNSDKGMVGKIKGAVGSWFGGKGEETQASEQSKSVPVGSAFDEAGNNNNNITGERSLQEAAN